VRSRAPLPLRTRNVPASAEGCARTDAQRAGGERSAAPQGATEGTTRRLAAAATAAALALTAPGCSPPSTPPDRLLVASVRQPATSLFFLAKSAGCFAGERLTVDEWSFELGRDALALLRDDGADAAIAFETPLLRAAVADGRLRVLTRLHTSTRNTRLVTRTQARIRSFSDLAGKRVGLPRGTNADFFLDVALGSGGLGRGEVTAVDLLPHESVKALERGDLDAAVLSDPYAGHAEERLGAGGRTLVTELYSEASLLITRTDVLAQREPALRALVRGLACGERVAHDRPDAALAAVSARVGGESPEALSAQLARVTWGLGLDNVLVDVLRRERQWLVAAGPAQPAGARPAELRELLDPRILEAVEPESVTLLPAGGGVRW
jgi:NitT/TauT family transport system substrate-binding protein